MTVGFEPPGAWVVEKIEEAEALAPTNVGAIGRDGWASDGYSGIVGVATVDAYVIVVTWEEPETGLNVHGVYGDERAAEADWGRIAEEYMNDGELPEDVEYRVEPVSR